MARGGSYPARGKKAAKKAKAKKDPAPPAQTREEEVAQFKEDLARAGEAEDAKPWPPGHPDPGATPSLGEDERAGRAAFNTLLQEAIDDPTLRDLIMVDGSATPQVRGLDEDVGWHTLKKLLLAFGRSEAVPDVVDPDGKVRVRRGAFSKGKRIPATELRKWLELTRDGKGAPEQVTLEGDHPEPPEGGRVEPWSSSGLTYMYPHYEARFTLDQIDSIRGADPEKQNSLVDRKMKLIADTVPPGETRDAERAKIIADIVRKREPDAPAAKVDGDEPPEHEE